MSLNSQRESLSQVALVMFLPPSLPAQSSGIMGKLAQAVNPAEVPYAKWAATAAGNLSAGLNWAAGKEFSNTLQTPLTKTPLHRVY